MYLTSGQSSPLGKGSGCVWFDAGLALSVLRDLERTWMFLEKGGPQLDFAVCPGVFLGDKGERSHVCLHFKGGVRTGWLQLGDRRNIAKAGLVVFSSWCAPQTQPRETWFHV